MGFSMSAVTLLAAVGSASAFSASPSMALGRGSFAPPLSLRSSSSRPVAAGRGFPSTRQGATKLAAVAEGVDAAQQLAFLAAHLDANSMAHIDQRLVHPSACFLVNNTWGEGGDWLPPATFEFRSGGAPLVGSASLFHGWIKTSTAPSPLHP